MRDGQFARMEKHAFQATLRERSVRLVIAVLVIAGDRVTEVREMDANLMSAPSLELRFEQAEIAMEASEAKNGVRFQPFFVDGRTVDEIGLPWPWGYAGIVPGVLGHDLTASVGDAYTQMREAQGFLCHVEP